MGSDVALNYNPALLTVFISCIPTKHEGFGISLENLAKLMTFCLQKF